MVAQHTLFLGHRVVRDDDLAPFDRVPTPDDSHDLLIPDFDVSQHRSPVQSTTLHVCDDDAQHSTADDNDDDHPVFDRSEPTPHDADIHKSLRLRFSVSQLSTFTADQDNVEERSVSATSTLDPYYLGFHSGSSSPVPPMPPPPPPPLHFCATPEHSPLIEPVTPARNPAAIDRRGLVGVGELATPRWTKTEYRIDRRHHADPIAEEDNAAFVPVDEVDYSFSDSPDSPWTIEAVDGEISEKDEQIVSMQAPPRTVRARPSIASESGGEEILYPRQHLSSMRPVLPAHNIQATNESLSLDCFDISGPPPTFTSPSKRAKKRASDDSQLVQSPTMLSKRSSVTVSKDRDDKSSSRRHRSLNLGSSPRDSKSAKRRESTTVLSLSTSSARPTASSVAKSADKHSRHSSSSSNVDTHHSKRGHTSDYSHLPPSPSSVSIQHFLKHGTRSPAKEVSQNYATPNVAHSLLRGTQEGWSGLDDEATAEALRKLDGISGKSARARASVGSFRAIPVGTPGAPVHKSGTHEAGQTTRVTMDGSLDPSNESIGQAISSDEHGSGSDKTPRKAGVRLSSSLTPKRGSASSTTYTSTPTTSSHDSMSAATSLTSVSMSSGRLSGKMKRNSSGSDTSNHSGDAMSIKDRVACLATNGEIDDASVPPVPPLPKDLSSYRSPPPTSTSLVFPATPGEEREQSTFHVQVSREDGSSASDTKPSRSSRQSHQYDSGIASKDESQVPRTPSKKWSFSGALSLKLGNNSSTVPSSSTKSAHATPSRNPSRSSLATEQLTSSSTPSMKPFSPVQPDAMASDSSLISLSSTGSLGGPVFLMSKTPDHTTDPSRSGTDSSASTSHNLSGLSASQSRDVKSPGVSSKRVPSKRLTPSSIPFFRRSSLQSIQIPPPSLVTPASPTMTTGTVSSQFERLSASPPKDSGQKDLNNYSSTHSTTHKKTSVLNFGSLLKGSSSRRSLHSDAKELSKDATRSREELKAKGEKPDKERKKDDKDRSESRISALMGRKRGKTLSAVDPRKPKEPVALPPMQISAIEPATAQRVARLKASSSSASASTPSTSSRGLSSRVTSQTVSSMQKQAEARARNQLPTIAGSPSIATNGGGQASKESKDLPPAATSNYVGGLPKETPTKIPRISSRTSAIASPTLKSTGARRDSMHINPNNGSPSTNEFGVMENEPKSTTKVSARHFVRASSPTTSSTSRVPRQPSISGSVLPKRSSNRDSISFSGLRKSSTGSVAPASTTAVVSEYQRHRFSALSPSKGLKLLAPKISLPRASSSSTPNIHQSPTVSSRPSFSTPSSSPTTIDEDELVGDEEMLHYIQRQQRKKMAAGASQEDVDELLRFPEPLPPGIPSTSTSVLKGSQAQYLSEYERKEILDYPSVYCIGARSKKKMATLNNSTNNYGYDDDRGDYQVVNHDHLAFRYEILDSLGKGSFGQVLHCRDHCTGESVAVKIIRNKKRFHHQALVEIKILDNLRKWDADEKHHVIKMTEHFYFRNHLCIAMELLSINLYELIKANGFVGFSTNLIRRFTSQMLMSLSLMRHHRIVHCDLKPENVLLKHPAKSAIKVIDFGSSCFEHEKIYTYIQSRFYRSPEVILGMNYHMAIDMWSLGCILAELYTGFPIFPGENEQEQLACIMEILDVPDKDFINRSSRKKLFFEPNGNPRSVVNSKGRRRRPGQKTLAQVLRCNDEDFVDFISKCLVWDPERRIKPQAALRHPFVTRRAKLPPPSATKSSLSTSSLGIGSRNKQILETPKKSQISAPTPLTARSIRANGNAPTTPNSSSNHVSTLGSSRSYRSSQPQLSSYSGRNVSGYASSVAK